jgi:hypothetical protein
MQHREAERKENPGQNPISRDQVFAAGKNLLSSIDVRSNLRFIYRWKLRSFARRFKWVNEFPDGISDTVLNDAILAAQKAVQNPSDKSLVRAALKAFGQMQGVGVPVASAFLTAMDPTQFTIIDRQAFKTLGAAFHARISDYLEYLWFCRGEAARLSVTLNEHDRALWQRGVEIGRAHCHAPRRRSIQ